MPTFDDLYENQPLDDKKNDNDKLNNYLINLSDDLIDETDIELIEEDVSDDDYVPKGMIKNHPLRQYFDVSPHKKLFKFVKDNFDKSLSLEQIWYAMQFRQMGKTYLKIMETLLFASENKDTYTIFACNSAHSVNYTMGTISNILGEEFLGEIVKYDVSGKSIYIRAYNHVIVFVTMPRKTIQGEIEKMVGDLRRGLYRPGRDQIKTDLDYFL